MEIAYTILGMTSIGYKAFSGVAFISGTFALKFYEAPNNMQKEGIFISKDTHNNEYMIGYIDIEESEKIKIYFEAANYLRAITILFHTITDLQRENKESFSLYEAFKLYVNNEYLIKLIAERKKQDESK